MPRNLSISRFPLANWCCLGVLSLVAAAGCGKSEELGQITGLVTYQGSPVNSGTVVFENRSLGVSVRASLDSEGRYQVRTHDRDGLPPGTYQVAVTSTMIGSGASPFVGGVEEKSYQPTGPPVPAKYHKVSTSGLSADVKPGSNVADFELE